jgi:hypothetical protein
MVAIVFGIISLLACMFLAYVFAQFHRELTQHPREITPHFLSGGFRFTLRDAAVHGFGHRQTPHLAGSLHQKAG